MDKESGNVSYKLEYATKAYITDAPTTWYLIDAQNGNIFSKKSLATGISGSGEIYQTNPLNGSPVTKTLQRLRDRPPYVLFGDNVRVINGTGGSEAFESVPEFDYEPTNTHFDEVMAYYHGDEFAAWLIGLGMPSNKVPQINIVVHHQTLYGQAQLYGSNTITFKDSGVYKIEGVIKCV